MNEWFKYSEFEDPKNYLDCYIFLTTAELQHIKNPYNKRTFISGLSNTLANFMYHVPQDLYENRENTQIRSDRYWGSYTWICTTFLEKEGGKFFVAHRDNWHHFKMSSDMEEKYPPIPKYLFEFYRLVLKQKLY